MSETNPSSSRNSGNSSADDRRLQVERLRVRFPSFEDDELAALAVERGWITRDQAADCRNHLSPTQVSQLSEALLSGQLGRIAAPSPFPAEVQAASLKPENRFGKYVMVREIGRGGMGVVHRAWQVDLGRWVALKQLRPEAADSAFRFVREGRLAAQVVHPNLVPIHEVGEIGGVPFLAMALIERGSLEGQRLPVRRALEVIGHVAVAVQVLHDAGIIHRDIKPGNILVDASNHVYLGDFSLARPEEAGPGLSKSGLLIGTPAFAPPEQIRGDSARIGPRSDVYSLGATLHSLLTGLPPFSGTDAFDVAQRSVDTEFPDVRTARPDAGEQVQTLCWKATRKNPADRYATAREFADDVRRFLSGEPLRAKPPTMGFIVRARLQRMIPWVAGLAVLGSLAFLLWPKDDDRIRKVAGLVTSGTALEREGRVTAARDAFRLAAELDPSNAQAKVGFDRTGTAVDDAARLIEAGRPALDKAAGLLYRKDLDIESWIADVEKGKAMIEAAVRKAPDSAIGHHLLGRAEEFRGEWEAAEAHWRTAIRLDPKLGQAHYQLGKLLLARSFLGTLAGEDTDRTLQLKAAKALLEEARREIQTAIDLGGGFEEEIQRTVMDAMRAYLAQDFKHLENLVEKTLKAAGRKDGVEELYWLWGLANMGPARLNALEKAIETRPVYLMALLGRADEYHKQHRMEASIRDYGDVLRLNPKLTVARYNRGVVLLESHLPDRAVQDFSEILRYQPDDVPSLANRGAAYRQLKDYAAATRDLDRAIQLDLTCTVALKSRAAIRMDQGDFKAALSDLSKALEAAPGNYETLTRRAAAHQALANWEEARGDYDSAIRLAPRVMDAYIGRASLRGRQRDYAGALEDAEKAVSLGAESPDAYAMRALARRFVGNAAGALSDFEKALELAPPEWPKRPDTERQIEMLKSR